jgi:hypothetical protein
MQTKEESESVQRERQPRRLREKDVRLFPLLAKVRSHRCIVSHILDRGPAAALRLSGMSGFHPKVGKKSGGLVCQKRAYPGGRFPI